MASLGEMLQYAEASQPRSGTAEVLTHALKGGMSGFQQQEKINAGKIGQYAKLLEIEKTIQEMEMQKNMAKYFGFMPYDEQELAAGRTAAFEELGATGKVKSHTREGGLQRVYDVANGKDYEAVPSYSSKGGFNVSLKKKVTATAKARTEGSERARRTAIETLADKFAKRYKSQQLKQSGRKDEEIGMLMMGYVPSMDEVKKFYPLAEKYYQGERSDFDTMFKGLKSEDDPEGLFDDNEGEDE